MLSEAICVETFCKMFRTNLHTNQKNLIHWLMCGAGGYLGVYALFLRGGVFGSAATGNLLECMIDLAELQLNEVLIRLGGGIMFALPFVISKWMELKTDVNRRRFALYLEMGVMMLLAMIPSDCHPVLALYPLFFTTGFQWSVFSGGSDYNSSTIFISNNTRQCFSGLAEYWITGNKESGKKASFYGISILSFLGAGVVSAIVAMEMGTWSSLVLIPYLLMARILL